MERSVEESETYCGAQSMPNKQELIRIREEVRSLAVKVNGQFSRRRVAKALQRYLQFNPHHNLSLSEVAYVIDVEHTNCSKLFKRYTGVTLTDWKRSVRIQIAKRHLKNTYYSVQRVAELAGYKDVTTFERNFRKCEDLSPIEFRTSVTSSLDFRGKR